MIMEQDTLYKLFCITAVILIGLSLVLPIVSGHYNNKKAIMNQLPLTTYGTYTLKVSRAIHFGNIYAAIIYVCMSIFLCYTMCYTIRIWDMPIEDESAGTQSLLYGIGILFPCNAVFSIYILFCYFKRLSDHVTVSAEGIVTSQWKRFRRVTISSAWSDIESMQIEFKKKHLRYNNCYHVPVLHFEIRHQEYVIDLAGYPFTRYFINAIDYYHGVATIGRHAEGLNQHRFVIYDEKLCNIYEVEHRYKILERRA